MESLIITDRMKPANKNNELEVMDFLSGFVLPEQKIIHNGGSVSNSADFIVLDERDPAPPSETIKAHYVITGNHLFLHSTNIDPWNVAGAMEDAGMPVDTIRDRRITITKRPGGAKRLPGSKGGSLKPGEYRDCSLAIRFWPHYPKQALDLTNNLHANILRERLQSISDRDGVIPHATIDAKKNKATQFVGPTLAVQREGSGPLQIVLAGKEIASTAVIERFLQTDPYISDKFHSYFAALGINKSTFKITHSSDPSGVPEHRYKTTKFYEAFAQDFQLSTATFRKTVSIR